MRRENEALEDWRRQGAAYIAAMVRDWWAGIAETVNGLSLLARQRQWQSTLSADRSFVTQLTDLGPNWMADAVSRSPSTAFPGPSENVIEEQQDLDWLPPREFAQSSGSSTMSSSFESLADLESSASSSHYSRESFSWGLRQQQQQRSASALMPPPDTPTLADIDSDNLSTDSNPSSVSSSLATDKEDVAGLIADMELSLNDLLEPYMSNGWVPQARPEPLESDDDSESQSYQAAVNTLRHEATLPLRQLLPPGYHPISGPTLSMNGGSDSPPMNTRRRQSGRRTTNRTATVPAPMVNGGSPSAFTEDDDMLYDSLGEDVSEDSSSEVCSVMSSQEPLEEIIPLSPGEMSRRARTIAHLKQALQTKSRRSLHTQLQAYGPTCRVPFLPTSTLCEFLDYLHVQSSVFLCRCQCVRV